MTSDAAEPIALVIGCDHTALALKTELITHLKEQNIHVYDIGAYTEEPADYPLIAEQAGKLVAAGEARLGILICGTGAGMSMAANKIGGVRCACCSEPYTAALSRRHNDANMLALGARVVGTELAKMIVDTWLAAAFEGGRHERRVAQINALDEK